MARQKSSRQTQLKFCRSQKKKKNCNQKNYIIIFNGNKIIFEDEKAGYILFVFVSINTKYV